MARKPYLSELLGRRLESKIKNEVGSYLMTLNCYWRMPVQSGYGKPFLDYEGCLQGLFFAIETKAPGKWLTPRQRFTAREILGSGGKVFIITDKDGLEAFKRWVSKCNSVSAEPVVAA